VESGKDAEELGMRAEEPPIRTEPRIAPLDALRGIAILMVLLVHCFWITPSSPAWVLAHRLQPGLLLGVDLFFVLSGYLITGILLRTRAEPHYFGSFYLRRILRILPAYYLVLALIFLVLPRFDAAVRDSSLHDYSAFYVLHLQNWLLALGAGGQLWPGASHFWSLAVEEQFYLVWPLVVLATPPRALRRVCLLLLILCVVSKLVLVGAHASWYTLYMSTLTRYDGLIVGALIATTRPQDIAPWARSAGALGLLAGLAIVAIVATAPEGRSTWRIALETSLAAVAFGAAIFRIHAGARPWTGPLLRSPGLLWLGRYSYGIYLLHLPIMFLLMPWAVRHRLLEGWPLNLRSLIGGACVIGLSLLLARLMYRFVEAPALNLRYRLTPEPRSPTEATA
jgi:peptidoglycan/LPS O-acetylase OafA/YrhL